MPARHETPQGARRALRLVAQLLVKPPIPADFTIQELGGPAWKEPEPTRRRHQLVRLECGHLAWWTTRPGSWWPTWLRCDACELLEAQR